MSDIFEASRLVKRIRGLGFGAGAIGNLYREISDEDAMGALRAALQHGVRYFDSAPHYGFGLSEKRIGFVFGEFGGEEAIIVSTKVGRVLVPKNAADLRSARQGFISPEPFESVFDYSYDGVMRSFEESRRRLEREIDILYAHDLGMRTHGDRHSEQMRLFMNGGYRAMRELREQGVVRAIGLGVNEWQVCEEVLASADFDIVLLAGRYTLLEQGALGTFLPLCVRRGIAVVVGGPYNSGILARDEQKQAAANYDYGQAPEEILARVESINAVCARHRVPLAAAALQFPLAHPAVITVLPGMSSAAEVVAAVHWMSIPIPAACWQELRAQRLLSADAPIPVAS
jgi:D-threo-aldose 1-dehydrogenase